MNTHVYFCCKIGPSRCKNVQLSMLERKIGNHIALWRILSRLCFCFVQEEHLNKISYLEFKMDAILSELHDHSSPPHVKLESGIF